MMDAAEIARLRKRVDDGLGLFGPDARALLDALEQARKELDELQGLKVTDEICFDRVVAQRDEACKERDDFAEQLALRSESAMHVEMQELMRLNNELVAQRDAALMERLDEDHLADLIAERDAAQQDAKEARALRRALIEIFHYAQSLYDEWVMDRVRLALPDLGLES